MTRQSLAMTLALASVIDCVDRDYVLTFNAGQPPTGITLPSAGPTGVDLLLVVDNSDSMQDNQTELLAQLEPLIQTLATPPCTSVSNPPLHACNASDPTDRPQYESVDLDVGVIDTDLGTPGSTVPGCDSSAVGDDGQLNPILQGPAMMMHEPWVGGFIPPTSFGRPSDCMNASEFPNFIEFSSGGSAGCSNPPCETDPTMFAHDVRCNAGLYVNGCALVSQIEAAYRALVWYDPSDHQGNTSPNAGFMRDNALLAIVWVTDNEDGSVRNAQYANSPPEPPLPSDATDVYNAASTAWGSANLSLRFYLYTPGGAQDPTWDLGRYVDPTNVNRGFLSLKPGHPERVLAAAITGIPLTGWDAPAGSTNAANWNALLGTQGPGGPDDFINRNSSTAINTTSAEGPISMWQNNPDLRGSGPNPIAHCNEHPVPACYRQGSTYMPNACDVGVQYFASPARREVEIVRRFDEDPLCNGGPCHNGLVASICQSSYGASVTAIARLIQSRLTAPCLLRPLAQQTDSDGHDTVNCTLLEEQPIGVDACDMAHGRTNVPDPTAEASTSASQFVTVDGQQRLVCSVTQLATNAATGAPADPSAHGWYYEPAASPHCPGVVFTSSDAPLGTATTILECP